MIDFIPLGLTDLHLCYYVCIWKLYTVAVSKGNKTERVNSVSSQCTHFPNPIFIPHCSCYSFIADICEVFRSTNTHM